MDSCFICTLWKWFSTAELENRILKWKWVNFALCPRGDGHWKDADTLNQITDHINSWWRTLHPPGQPRCSQHLQRFQNPAWASEGQAGAQGWTNSSTPEHRFTSQTDSPNHLRLWAAHGCLQCESPTGNSSSSVPVHSWHFAIISLITADHDRECRELILFWRQQSSGWTYADHVLPWTSCVWQDLSLWCDDEGEY